MTYAIVNDFPHHPYTRMSQPIMPDLECINILKITLYATCGTSFMYV
jgi:hypothetical protein